MTKLIKINYLVVGAGPTGLGVGYRLNQLGRNDYLIIDKQGCVGGLSRSYLDDMGFTWDCGGHVQFSHYEYFDEVMNLALSSNKWLNHIRESWVWINKVFVPYPIQNNIKYLGVEFDYIDDSNSQIVEKNFKDWLLKSFGEKFCKIFFFPYNKKVWAYPLEMLDYHWVSDRVAKISSKKNENRTWGPNNYFKFPLYGGTGSIWDSLSQKFSQENIILNTEICSLDVNNKVAKTKCGKCIEYNNLISSAPLDCLIDLINVKSPEINRLKQHLKFSSTNIVCLGLEGEIPKELEKMSWMYFPESNSPYYRVTVFSNYSPNNVPNSKINWSLMTEVSESKYKPVNKDTIVDEVIMALIEDNLLNLQTTKIISRFYKKFNYGYPTPFLGRDEIVSNLNNFLENYNIYSRGRFGHWKYEVSNQDHSFMQGVEIVNRLEFNTEEVTINRPNDVNDRKIDYSFWRPELR